MAFTISRSQSASLTEREIKDDIIDHHHIGDKDDDSSGTMGISDSGVSSQLHLKSSLSSASKASSQSLDKHVVLRRIKQRKSYNKAKRAFEALFLGSSEANTTNTGAPEQKWLQHGDSFSSP